MAMAKHPSLAQAYSQAKKLVGVQHCIEKGDESGAAMLLASACGLALEEIKLIGLGTALVEIANGDGAAGDRLIQRALKLAPQPWGMVLTKLWSVMETERAVEAINWAEVDKYSAWQVKRWNLAGLAPACGSYQQMEFGGNARALFDVTPAYLLATYGPGYYVVDYGEGFIYYVPEWLNIRTLMTNKEQGVFETQLALEMHQYKLAYNVVKPVYAATSIDYDKLKLISDDYYARLNASRIQQGPLVLPPTLEIDPSVKDKKKKNKRKPWFCGGLGWRVTFLSSYNITEADWNALCEDALQLTDMSDWPGDDVEFTSAPLSFGWKNDAGDFIIR